MSICRSNFPMVHRGFNNGMFGFGGFRTNEFQGLNCGFDASWSRVAPRCECRNHVVINKAIKEFPMTCEPPKRITIDRVTTLAGIDNALFLVGDVDGYRMNENYNVVISDDIIGFQSFNMPSYLFLKTGDLHTLAVSTADIQNHPISAFLRQNQHLFGGSAKAMELFEIAPQDFNVEANHDGHHCDPFELHPVIRVIAPTSLNIRYVTIEVRWYDHCGQFHFREIFYIIPVICFNGHTAKGNSWANWADDIRTCGETIRIPGEATDNGQFRLADKPICGCPPFRGRAIPFGGFHGRMW